MQGLEFNHEEPPQTDDVKELARYASRLFRRLAHISQEYAYIRLKELNVAPDRTFTGLTVLADGTNWNPGAGQGVYTYYNSTWNKLG